MTEIFGSATAPDAPHEAMSASAVERPAELSSPTAPVPEVAPQQVTAGENDSPGPSAGLNANTEIQNGKDFNVGPGESIAPSKELHQEEDKEKISADAGIEQNPNVLPATMDGLTYIEVSSAVIQQPEAASPDTQIMREIQPTAAPSFSKIQVQLASLAAKTSNWHADVQKGSQASADIVTRCKALAKEIQEATESLWVME
jgi:hypothetical protein